MNSIKNITGAVFTGKEESTRFVAQWYQIHRSKFVLLQLAFCFKLKSLKRCINISLFTEGLVSTCQTDVYLNNVLIVMSKHFLTLNS